MKKTIKTFMIFMGILSLISCNTPLNENVEKTSNNETEIIDNDEKNTENTNDEDESNETEVTDDTESEKDNTDEEIIDDENEDEDEKDNTDEEIINDDTESESEKDNTDEEIIDDENNGTLNYLFSENTLLCDFDYVIYYNNKITNWKFYTSSNSTHAQITVNNSFNIRIEITANTITVTRGFGCFRNVVINDIKINDNVITIKVSQ